MEISDKGYEMVTEALDDIINKAITGIQEKSPEVALHEIRALGHFTLKILRNESLITGRKAKGTNV
ncbi:MULTISPECIES: hypothetical protein [Treponema]|uniref:hypothetical protein n=1 Tax=Treponema TaxID=157 RepID=UPI0020A26739|nr:MULTISPECIES: hypothetical protein [Treponema]UTC46131.1 hypothetical protein E4N72_05935 [Treponema vincentii]UTC51029.1 hypothetical protein E4N65_01400 [Treponema sp. OMZ 855]